MAKKELIKCQLSIFLTFYNYKIMQSFDQNKVKHSNIFYPDFWTTEFKTCKFSLYLILFI